MSKVSRIEELYIEFTTRCNLKCVYCLHSTSAYKERIKDLNPEEFYHTLDILMKELDVRGISTTGIGEFTLMKNWRNIIQYIQEIYPYVTISLFSNFARKLSDEEIDTLTKVKRINISMDTVDPELFHFLRSGDVSILLDNIHHLNERCKITESKLYRTIASVVNSRNIDYLEELLDYIIENKIADELMLTPMTLPLPAAKLLDVYPVSIYFNEEKADYIAFLLKKLHEKGKKNGIKVSWSGDLQDFYCC
ncbi:MAG TPA: hypothetical protein DCW90_14640 [Lachnospiraceae bacterium]|nr:radical SAM protein [uncultured Lachnoclostridium sp.]HAU86672.1 hypothetical protein [Lachnospiraceae bacterium]